MPNDVSNTPARQPVENEGANPFARRQIPDAEALARVTEVHRLRHGHRCDTERAGHRRPGGRSPLQIVVDATEGFIPLWAPNVVLRWQYANGTLAQFQNPEAAADVIERLLADAILAWGDFTPVRFSKNSNNWDFEIVMRSSPDCDATGCVLASAFFPDAGRHQLTIYPTMFEQPREEQVETMAHEIGHIFGLRHFFAKLDEAQWESEIFGAHNARSIMNYGDESEMTDADRDDLKALYHQVWHGGRKDINGTPIHLVRPYHETEAVSGGAVAIAAARA